MAFLAALKTHKAEDDSPTIPPDLSRILGSTDVAPGAGIWAFGLNGYGRLGRGTEDEGWHPRPEAIPSFTDTVLCPEELAGGAAHMVAVVQGRVFVWGKCHFGQLGLGHEWMTSTAPTPIDSAVLPRPVVRVACGTSHSFAIDCEGVVRAWGCGFHGATGLGSESHCSSPQPIDSQAFNGEAVVGAAGGEAHSLFLTASGKVFGAGKGAHGQLGQGAENLSNALSPVPVLLWPGDLEGTEALTTVSIPVSSNVSAAVSSSGRLFTWGDNSCGQCGVEDPPEAPTTRSVVPEPTEVQLPGGVRVAPGLGSVAGGIHHMIARTTEGSVFTWGKPGSCLGLTLSSPSSPSVSSAASASSAPVAASALSAAAGAGAAGTGAAWVRPALRDLRWTMGGADITETRAEVEEVGKETQTRHALQAVWVAAGETHSVVVMDDGSVLTCGTSMGGKLGEQVPGAAPVSTCSSFLPVACFQRHAKRGRTTTARAVAALGGSNHTAVITAPVCESIHGSLSAGAEDEAVAWQGGGGGGGGGRGGGVMVASLTNTTANHRTGKARKVPPVELARLYRMVVRHVRGTGEIEMSFATKAMKEKNHSHTTVQVVHRIRVASPGELIEFLQTCYDLQMHDVAEINSKTERLEDSGSSANLPMEFSDYFCDAINDFFDDKTFQGSVVDAAIQP